MSAPMQYRYELVQQLSGSIGGVVSHHPAAHTLIAGYILTLRGTSVSGDPVSPADLGGIKLTSAAASSLINEHNCSFIAERTRRLPGSPGWIQPSAAGDPVRLQFIHLFGLRPEHGNVYPVPPGDVLEWYLPSVPSTVLAQPVWGVHAITADRGDAYYLVRHNSRNLDMAEVRFALSGKTAIIQLGPLPTGTGVVDPDHIAIFDSAGKRCLFMPYEDALGVTNAMDMYAPSEAEQVVYSTFGADRQSVIKCYANDTYNVEITGGAGLLPVSHGVVEPIPAGGARIAGMASAMDVSATNARVSSVAGPAGAVSAAALTSRRIDPGGPSAEAASGATPPASVSAPIATPPASVSAPIRPRTPADVVRGWKRSR